MRTGAEKFEGVGGGHDAAAGARITKDKLDEFLDYLEANVINVQSSSNSWQYYWKKGRDCKKSSWTWQCEFSRKLDSRPRKFW